MGKIPEEKLTDLETALVGVPATPWRLAGLVGLAVLYFVFLNLSMQHGISDWHLRLPAFLFSLTALASLFVLARRIAGTGAGLLAAALLGLSPTFLFFATDVGN